MLPRFAGTSPTGAQMPKKCLHFASFAHIDEVNLHSCAFWCLSIGIGISLNHFFSSSIGFMNSRLDGKARNSTIMVNCSCLLLVAVLAGPRLTNPSFQFDCGCRSVVKFCSPSDEAPPNQFLRKAGSGVPRSLRDKVTRWHGAYSILANTKKDEDYLCKRPENKK